jgi:serine/threonine-protein kinase
MLRDCCALLGLEPGLLIAGRYRLERKLADGGMGTVWVARHVTLDCRIAVKFVCGAGAEAAAQFEQEAKMAAMLGSKTDYVVRIFDFGVDDGMPFIAMELLEGEDLGARLSRSGALPPADVAPIAAQVACALKKAHALGVVHHDLKPENVFLVRRDDEERVKLLDFGLAKLIEPGGPARLTQPMGTLHYMAPELLTSHRADHRADLWSFAVVLYRAVTGALPFDNESLAELVMDICTGAATPATTQLPELDGRLDTFFARALRRDPDERFQQAEEMARSFAEAARVTWRPPPTTSAPPPPLPSISPSAYEPWPERTRRSLLELTRGLAAGY